MLLVRVAKTLPRLTYKLYLLVRGRLREEISEIHPTALGQSCSVAWSCCSLLPLVPSAVAFWVVEEAVAFCLDAGDRVPRASTNQIPVSWGPAVPEPPARPKLRSSRALRHRTQPSPNSVPGVVPIPQKAAVPWALQDGRSVRAQPLRTDRLPAKRGALCPRAGLSSPSHVCLTALSARRDPGFQAELSHAIVPQNSSAPVFLARLKWADMFDFPLFSPACVRAVSPCFCRRVWRCCGAGTRSWEMVARAARAALHTWTCTKLIF